MTVDRRIQLWSALVEHAADAEMGLEHVGATMVTVAGFTGAAIAVRLSATPREAVYASDRVATEPLGDLGQVATIGPIKAIDRYDARRNVPFAGYATPTILGEIKRYFRDATGRSGCRAGSRKPASP
jgi:hypothetical protein